MKKIQLYLPEKQLSYFNKRSNETGLSLSEEIRSALSFFIEFQENKVQYVVRDGREPYNENN